MYLIQLFEDYFKLRILNDFLKENFNNFTTLHWKVLSFQILYALYKLTKTYPSFRHNKLDTYSIYVYIKKESDNKNVIKIGNKIFSIPNMGFEIKITNFYFFFHKKKKKLMLFFFEYTSLTTNINYTKNVLNRC